MLQLSYIPSDTLQYVDSDQRQWTIRLVQDVVDFVELISQLTRLAEGFPSSQEKLMIVSSDYRAKVAVNAFIRFCPALDGLLHTADTLDEAEAYMLVNSRNA
jgi:hypothetical protein